MTKTTERPALAVWLERQRALWMLLGDAEYRRAGYRLLFWSIRGWLGWSVWLAAVGLGVLAAFLAEPLLGNPHAAWRFVAGAAAVGATLLGSALYRTEQQAGTLELMWLACGSERALLWLRLVGALVALAVVLVPATMVLSWFLAGTFPMGYALMHGMMLGFFVLSTVGLAGTWLPQAWASAVMMGALFGAIFLTVGTEPSILNPFLDPWSDQVRQSSLTTARVLQLGLGLILLRSTAARLRKAL